MRRRGIIFGMLWVIGIWGMAFPAEATRIVYRRHVDCKRLSSNDCADAIRTAVGQSPSLNLRAATETDTVHGYVDVAFCDDRTLSVDELVFKDGTRQVATAQNIGRWLAEQGHDVVSIVGDTVTCDSIITVELYDQDDDPTHVVLPSGKVKQVRRPGARGRHLTTFRRPAVMPTEAEVVNRLNALTIP